MNILFIPIFAQIFNMKKILLIAVCILGTVSIASAQVIGFIKNTQSRITANLDPIKAEWEKLLKDQGNEAVLTNFEIQSGADRETGKTYYLLLATNRNKSIKVARGLLLKAGNLSFYKEEVKPFGIVVCSGCAGACAPDVSGGNWFCDSECQIEGQKCTKSTTIDWID